MNGYLWRATLDTLAFMPLASADPYGGVVITDWYTNPEKPDERFKCTVYILDARLRADGLNVAVFKQNKDAGRRLDRRALGQPDRDGHRELHPDPRAPASTFEHQGLTGPPDRSLVGAPLTRPLTGSPTPVQSLLKMARYNPKETEPKWRKAWADADAFRAVIDPARPKYYVLEMFPYPSGRLHMGHVRNYALGDVIARFKRARGFSVLHPMGWDAFGLPAENAAMERGVDPKGWTYDNIARMRAELKELGLSIDWSREFATCDLAYYGQQQALFLDLFARGLVYRKEGMVNWDPVDMTVLANEQVVDGRGWRSGAVVEKRKLNQWFLRITDYADQLTDGLATLDRWPEKVRRDAGELDRPLQGPEVLASRSPAPRRRASRPGWRSTPPGPTPCSARASWASPPTIRWPSRSRRAIPRPPPSSPSASKGGASQAEIDTAEKMGFDTGLQVEAPLRSRPGSCRSGSPTSS